MGRDAAGPSIPDNDQDHRTTFERLEMSDDNAKETDENGSGESPCYAEMVVDIKIAINAVASVYPTAFDLYDEPLDRLAHRLGHLFRDKYSDSFSVDAIVSEMLSER